MSSIATDTPTTRFEALDGLRGLAALAVLNRHVFNSVDLSVERQIEILHGPLSLFLNAQGGVQLFFVLSGFVLSGSLARSQGFVDVVRFFVRRIFRIHPPYVAALLLAWCGSFLYSDSVVTERGFSAWLQSLTSVHIAPQYLLDSLKFPGAAYRQLMVGWTLTIELAFSFLMPLLFLAASRGHWLVLAVLGAPLLFGAEWRFWWYGWDFAIGVAVYVNRERIVARLRSFGGAGGVLLFSAGFVLLQMSVWTSGDVVSAQGRVVSGFGASEIFFMGIGAAALIVGALTAPAISRALETRPIRFLGKISFSLYLVHTTVLFWVASWFHVSDPISIGVFYLVVLILALVAATAGYYAIERPSMRVGRRISAAKIPGLA